MTHEEYLDYLHKGTGNNREDKKHSKFCACAWCLKVFPASFSNMFLELNGKTFDCPYCGMDSLIFDTRFEDSVINVEDLVEIRVKYFGSPSKHLRFVENDEK